MTETNKQASEQNTKAPEESLAKADTVAQRSEKASVSNVLSKTVISASFVISLAALTGSSWLFYQSQQNNVKAQLTAIKSTQANLAAQIQAHNKNASQLNDLTKQVASIESGLNQQAATIQSEQNFQKEQILSLVNRVRQIDSATKEDWKLAEAEYLVRLANQRILLESDLNGAETLLTNADGILAEMEDPMFFDARKAIAKDIQALKSTSHFDVEGRYLQLSALYDQISQLPQREPSKKWLAENTQDSSSKLQEATSEVGNTLNKIWSSIKSLVVINYNHKPIKALLPPAEYQELVTGLQLQIDVAQVALVKGENSIYQKALARVANAINDNFDTRAQSVTAFMTSLTSLQQVNPSPELPLPRDSLSAMKSLMKAWNNRTVDNVKTPEEKSTPAPSQPTNIQPTDTPTSKPDSSTTTDSAQGAQS